MSKTTHKEYMKMCSGVEFCNIHPDTEITVEDGHWIENGDGIEEGTVIKYCSECDVQNMFPVINRDFEEKDDMW